MYLRICQLINNEMIGVEIPMVVSSTTIAWVSLQQHDRLIELSIFGRWFIVHTLAGMCNKRDIYVLHLYWNIDGFHLCFKMGKLSEKHRFHYDYSVFCSRLGMIFFEIHRIDVLCTSILCFSEVDWVSLTVCKIP